VRALASPVSPADFPYTVYPLAARERSAADLQHVGFGSFQAFAQFFA
jgi:hypothetical protein